MRQIKLKLKNYLLLTTIALLFFSPLISLAEVNQEHQDVEVTQEELDTSIDESKEIAEEEGNELESTSDKQDGQVEEELEVEEVEEEIEKNEEDAKTTEQEPVDKVTEDSTNQSQSTDSTSMKLSSATLPFGQGSKGNHVVELKKNLTKLAIGNYPENPSDFYGDSTTKNVVRFQKYYGLEETGVVDRHTQSAIEENVNSPYQIGESGNHVVELKKNLTTLGIGNYPANPSGSYGDSTARNIIRFQKLYGLNENGIADEVTLAKIDEMLILRQGVSGNHVVKLKQNLSKLGIGNYPTNPSNFFGTSTTNNVLEFQRYYGLNTTGIADENTLSVLERNVNSSYQIGQRGSHVVELKKNLTELGIGNYPATPSGTYGDSTARNVMKFQSSQGLKENGIADDVTLAKINDLLVLQQGARRESVIELKRNLSKLGIGNYPANPSNFFGSSTTNNVKAFQQYYGLDVTGIADAETLDAIDRNVNSSYQVGKSGSHIVALKQNLTILGIGNYPESPSGTYGDSTARNVKRFQNYYSLNENGIADETTLNKISEILNSPYSSGNSGAHVVELKENLKTLGIGNYPSNPSGSYGSSTARNVHAFQSYYGLYENGIADEVTLNKIQEILNSPYRLGNRGNHVVELKRNLSQLGYGEYTQNPSPDYDTNTENYVKEFQRSYGLNVSGIADEVTLAKIDEVLASRHVVIYQQFDITLDQALNVQMNQLQQTDKYRNNPAYVHSNYIEFVERGRITGDSVRLRTAPTFDNNIAFTVNSGTAVEILGQVTGDLHAGSTSWYKISYNNRTLYVHKSLVNPQGKIALTTTRLNVRAEQNSSSHIYGTLAAGATVNIVNEGGTWHEIRYGSWRNPTRSDVRSYLDPARNDEFQHLDLSSSVGVSTSEINKVIAGRGTLNGQGAAFIEAGRLHSVNELYLISHALLETGNGGSNLAKGIEVGLNSSGNPVLVTSSNRSSLTNIRTTYNMFGIGAADTDPDRLGAIRAYQEGWFTPRQAIIGGAKFIGERYIHNQYKQNTLYKMRWNPANPGYPQYATDIEWATKQVTRIKDMYRQLDNPMLRFNIVRYK